MYMDQFREQMHNAESREAVVAKAEAALRDIFAQYGAQGVDSVYLWGSVLRPDFNPTTSDVDSIGIASDTLPYEVEKEIQDRLKAMHPEIKKFGFRLLYESELRGGPTKGFLASVQSPKFHVLDLPHWQHVDGVKFEQSDFLEKLPTFREAVVSEIPHLRARQNDYESGKTEAFQHYVKKIAQIIDLLQRERGVAGRFAYDTMVSQAEDGLERQVAEALMEIKKASYDPVVIKKYESILAEFAEQVYGLQKDNK